MCVYHAITLFFFLCASSGRDRCVLIFVPNTSRRLEFNTLLFSAKSSSWKNDESTLRACNDYRRGNSISYLLNAQRVPKWLSADDDETIVLSEIAEYHGKFIDFERLGGENKEGKLGRKV